MTALRPDGSADLAPADVATMLGALADAATYRRERAGLFCTDCPGAPPAGLCAEHIDDLDAAGDYSSLAARLDGAR